jgi:hypothetical protein
MELIQYFEQIKAQLKAEEEKELAEIKAQVTCDCQIRNEEIDKITSQTIAQCYTDNEVAKNAVLEHANRQITALDQKYQDDVKKYTEDAENKKKEIFTRALNTASLATTTKYEKAIVDIDNLILKRKDKE